QGARRAAGRCSRSFASSDRAPCPPPVRPRFGRGYAAPARADPRARRPQRRRPQPRRASSADPSPTRCPTAMAHVLSCSSSLFLGYDEKLFATRHATASGNFLTLVELSRRLGFATVRRKRSPRVSSATVICYRFLAAVSGEGSTRVPAETRGTRQRPRIETLRT